MPTEMGNKPILDGDNQYPTYLSPSGNPSAYAIMVGGASSLFSNVNIKNVRIQNMYPGGGIIFDGTSTGKFRGPGLVQDCEIINMGHAAVNIYEVPNDRGSAGAIKIERNKMESLANYAKNTGLNSWPQVINANGTGSYGHECRYNTISDSWGEGIGAGGMSIVEYNIVSGIQGPGIYKDLWKNSGEKQSTVIRYNLLWRNPSTQYSKGNSIRIQDERVAGNNTDTVIEIYGNIVIGAWAGIELRNDPSDGNASSRIGRVLIYNNTLIDNDRNIVGVNSDWFNKVIVRNNASIISSDSQSTAVHTSNWGTGVWDNWDISNNYYYGKNTTQESVLPASFRGNNVFGTEYPLQKTSGWRRLEGNPSFSDMYPRAGSELNDRVEATVISGYSQYLTTGTDWSAMPGTPTFVRVNQSDYSKNWDFGAIIFSSNENHQPSPLLAPVGIKVLPMAN
jgi:hypothetical protein